MLLLLAGELEKGHSMEERDASLSHFGCAVRPWYCLQIQRLGISLMAMHSEMTLGEARNCHATQSVQHRKAPRLENTVVWQRERYKPQRLCFLFVCLLACFKGI